VRHFRSILYALVLAPAVWVLAAVGFTHDLTTRGRGDFAVESASGLLLLALAGAAYAILLLAPISPAGPLLGGLAFLGVSVWALVSPGGYAGVWPSAVAKEGFDLSRPGYGLAAMLALPLLCLMLSARRWARYEPPVLPLIGQVGRARGKAVVASADPTVEMRIAVSTPPPDATAAEPTVLNVPPVEATAAEPTVASTTAEGIEDEATIAVPTHRDERRTVIVVSADETTSMAALCDGQASTKQATVAPSPTEPAVQEPEPAEVPAEVGTAGTAVSADDAAEVLAEAEAVTAAAAAAAAEAEAEAADAAEAAADLGADDDVPVEFIVVGRAKPVADTRVVAPDLEETRSLEAPDPDRTRAIRIGELTTKLQITPADGEEPVNEPVRARASVAAPDSSEPDLSDVTRSLTAPDPDTTRTFTVVSSDDPEITRALDAPDPDRTQTGKIPELAGAMRLRPPVAPPEMAAHPGTAPSANTTALSHTGDIGGDETQVIQLDPERTHIIRPGSVEPPGERTEIIRLPVTGKSTVAVRAERTGGSDKSEVTLMNRERPIEHDDPEVPSPRRPSAEES